MLLNFIDSILGILIPPAILLYQYYTIYGIIKIGDIMNDTIFRAYDIRGVYGVDFDDLFAYELGQAFGSKLHQMNQTKTIVGYDNRMSSIPLYHALINGILSTGIDVISIGMVTTPMYYFSWYFFELQSGIMITASHNPKEYNGFKMSLNGIHNAYGEDIQNFKEFMKQKDFIHGKGKLREEDIKDRYVSFLLEQITLGPRKLKIVADAGNGAASLVIHNVLSRLNIDVISLYTDSDPNYPHHHPDPSVMENLKDLSEMVIKEKADIGFAYDGDADRIGLVDDTGKPINIDQFMIIMIRDLLPKLEDKRILYDVKCSKALEDEIVTLGGIPVLSRTGNSYLRAKIAQDNIKFGGELSGHVFFNDKFPGYDDGIYASLRMMEVLSNTSKKVSELLQGISTYINTPELKIVVREDNKFELVEKVKEYAISKGYHYSDVDGCKILFDDGFVLIRASNTGPYLTTRFEAKNQERLDELQEEFNNVIKSLI